MGGKLIFNNFLYSGFQCTDFDEKYARNLANTNFGLFLAMISAPVVGLLHLGEQFGFNSHIHAINCFIFSAVQLLLILYLRRSVNNQKIVSYLGLILLFLIFSSNLIFSVNEATRLIWFFVLFFITDILCGVKIRNASIVSTLLLFVIYFCWPGVNTNISHTEIISSLIIIFLVIVLFQFYDRKFKESALDLSIVNTALKESEEKYRGIFHESVAAIYVFDREKNFIDSNQAGLDLLGYSRDELLSITITDVDTEPDAVIPAHNLLLGGERTSNYEHQLVRKDGQVITVLNNSKPLTGADGTAIGMQSTLIDITDRKLAEEERLQALREISSIMETVPDIIYMLDLEGKLINWKKSLEDKTGYTKDELKDKVSLELVHHEDRESATDAIEQTFKKGYATRELRLFTKEGKSIPHFFSGKVKRDKNGKVIGIVGVAKDITDLKQLEKQLRQAHKMEALGVMAGGVAHDLNNILSGIVSYPELLLLQLPKDSELREPLVAIQKSGNRAAAVVADLLTVARGAASRREPYNLNSIIEEYLDSPECKKLKSLHPKVRCQHQLDALQPYILCSSVHIKKSLMNLVTNAAEAIVGEGNISVTTSNRHIDEVASAEHDMKKGGYVVLSVHDTGPGISKKDLDHIFEPFYSKKVMARSGTGLGLTIVWNTVQEHGGKIFVESSDKGTCFQLYFPVSKEKGSVQAENDVREDLTGNGEHILIVDDEPQLRDIAGQILQSQGYKVDSVSSGELAIKFVEENPVDLMVIDMLMEPGMNGRQTYEEIIKLYPDQKAILASGFSKSADVKATLKLGAAEFIKKPYSMDQLGRAVKGALNN